MMAAQAAQAIPVSRYTSYVAQRQVAQLMPASPAATGPVAALALPSAAAASKSAGRAAAPAAALRLKVLGAVAALVLWSVTYLYRQPADGGLAVEGMLLALAWLSALTAGCFALLTGWVELREPGGR